jgi:hypothetical protein
MRSLRAVAAALLVFLATSCAPATGEPAAAAEQFHAALQEGSYGRACALLAPMTKEELESSEGKPCAEALASLRLDSGGAVKRTEVFGGNAQVRLGPDTLFLTESGDTWRVTAAGCTARGGRPYECQLKGT